MNISKLEIFGFKSFAKKETVHFNSGITGIVGPNGCGKTNIVDAIRWVLGEQKTKRLRSSKMEEVIFNGASNVKPLGLCEVFLTIENNKGLYILILKFKSLTLSICTGTISMSSFLTNCAGIVVVKAFSLKKFDKIPSDTLWSIIKAVE